MPRANIFSADFEYDAADPDGYRNGLARVGEAAGGQALAVKLYELPVGQSVCPYHYEYEEEWLLVLEGAVVVRAPDGEHELARGEIVCFAPGPAGVPVRPAATGSSSDTMTIGIVFVARRAASIAGTPTATMTVTFRRTRSSACCA